MPNHGRYETFDELAKGDPTSSSPPTISRGATSSRNLPQDDRELWTNTFWTAVKAA